MAKSRTFNFKDVSLIVGADAIRGFHDGTVIEVEPGSDEFTKAVGADGDVSRAASNDRTCLIRVTLQQTSPSNDVLSRNANIDRATGSAVLPVILRDARGGTLIASESCWVKKLPTASYNKGEVNGWTWELDCGQCDMFLGGNPA